MTVFLHIGDIHYVFDDYTHDIMKNFFGKIIPQCDVLLIGGDVISHSQLQWESILSMIQARFPKQRKFFVMGNHDYWGFTNYHFNMSNINNLLKQYGIEHLEGNEINMIDDIALFGFGGWYGSSDPPSRDYEYIPKFLFGKSITSEQLSFHDRLYQKAEYMRKQILEHLPKYKKSIILTHFEPNTHPMGAPAHWMDEFRDKAQERLVLCCGHSHMRVEAHSGAFTHYNHGSDYNSPDYIKFELF